MASFHEHISNVWRDADIKIKTWFKNERYEETLFSVLGQAVADCVLKEGAYADSKLELIEFKGATPLDIQYTRAYCNALLYWNYVNCVINLNKEPNDALNTAYDIVKDKYSKHNVKNKDFLATLDASKYDIEKYITDLKLIDYFKSLVTNEKGERINLFKHAVHSEIDKKDSDNKIKLKVKTKRLSIDCYSIESYNISVTDSKISDVDGLSVNDSGGIDNMMCIHLPCMTVRDISYDGGLYENFKNEVENKKGVINCKYFKINDGYVIGELPQKTTLFYVHDVISYCTQKNILNIGKDINGLANKLADYQLRCMNNIIGMYTDSIVGEMSDFKQLKSKEGQSKYKYISDFIKDKEFIDTKLRKRFDQWLSVINEKIENATKNFISISYCDMEKLKKFREQYDIDDIFDDATILNYLHEYKYDMETVFNKLFE